MPKWELSKFKVEKTNNTLTFEIEILIPEIKKTVSIIYDDKKLITKGIELKQNYILYELIAELERLLDSPLIKELAKHSRKQEYRRFFTLTKIENYPEGILANLRYEYNNKYLEFGSVLVYPLFRDPNKLCNVDLTVETNAASNAKIFYDLMTTICTSSINIYVNINRINKILNMILQQLQTVYIQTTV
ncbi:hypothetical protein AVT98_gp42 [Sulfolobales virus YNP1]|uniref:hypothetical protein n=1 Tax=Sulfolobales virus YNP1 TaxID=1732179 RepID=UPI00070660E6|nr:hypothetical protein AVT98_gp42 [Sulfolobales virus YNP1]ALG97134.1 hypothetical protein [Sulfolobales virus YNP1]